MCKSLVSIIILSYNNLQYYKECIDSVLMQDYQNIELIFSDDCSDDFDLLEIEKYIVDYKKDNVVNIIVNYNNVNMGTVKHLNKVIKMSSGKYIKLLAVDDVLYEKDTISKAIEFLEYKKALMCVGYIEKYDEQMRNKISKSPSIEEVGIINKGDFKEIHRMLCISGGFLPAPGIVHTRNFFEKYGFFDKDYTLLEDKSINAKAVREGCKVYFLDEIITKYRDGGISSAGKSNLYLKKDKEIFNAKETFPYWGVSLKNYSKDYIIWGTSISYIDNREKLKISNFKYFIDSDIKKHGEIIDNKRVYPPEQLLKENLDNVMVIICSAFYIEISRWLEDKGFSENLNYIHVNFIKEI